MAGLLVDVLFYPRFSICNITVRCYFVSTRRLDSLTFSFGTAPNGDNFLDVSHRWVMMDRYKLIAIYMNKEMTTCEVADSVEAYKCITEEQCVHCFMIDHLKECEWCEHYDHPPLCVPKT